MRLARLLSTLAVLGASASVAIAQTGGTINQSGNIVPGHLPVWQANRVLRDGGFASGATSPGQSLGELLQVNPASPPGTGPDGTHSCLYSNILGLPHNWLCFDANALGGPLIDVGSSSGLTALTFKINGALYPFPSSGGNVLGPTSPVPVAGDLAIWNGGLAISDGGRVNWLNPLQYGAVGNGVTDDTAAYIAAATASYNTGVPLDLPAGYQFAVTSVFAYANTKTVFEPGACLVQKADGNATLATLPSPGATPGPTLGVWLDHPCVHQAGHTGVALLAEQATSIRIVSPQWDGIPTTACTWTHNDGVNVSGTYPCAGLMIKGITGVTGVGGNLGPYYWHVTSPSSYMPFGSVIVSGTGVNSFSFTGNTCGVSAGIGGCSNTSTPPTIGAGNAVADMTAPGGQIPAGTTVTSVTSQINGTVNLSGPHTIQVGDVIQFTTAANPAFVTLTTAGQTNTRPNFGTMDGHPRFTGYNLVIQNCSGSDNTYDTPDWSENTIGFENGGCGINVVRNRIIHPYQENDPIYGIWNTADANQNDVYGAGLRIVDNYASTGGTFTPLFDQGQGTNILPSHPTGRPNLLLNGAVDLDQPNEGAAVTLSTGVTSSGPDGWEAAFANAGAAGVNMTRLVEGPSPATYGLDLTNTGAGTVVATSSVAAQNVAIGDEISNAGFGATGQSVCQSFAARSSLSGTFGAYVSNAAGTRSFTWPFTLVGGGPWQTFSNCFPVDGFHSFTVTASISGTTMTVSSVPVGSNNVILPGNGVGGAGVTAGTTVISQLSGTQYGVGSYRVSASQTVGSESITIGGPWTVSGPTRALVAGVMIAAGATEQITPGAWTNTLQTTQGVGVSGQSTSFVTTNGATFDVTLMKLEVSDQPTDYMREPEAVRLARARQRYWKTFPQGTKAATARGLPGAVCKVATNATAGTLSLQLQVPTMLGNPVAVTTYNPSAANANWRDVTGSSDAVVNVDPSTAIGDGGVEISEQTTALTVGHNYCIHATLDARP